MENSFFDDEDHPSVISKNDFDLRNREVFENIKLVELE
jgi:hypothetical protein